MSCVRFFCSFFDLQRRHLPGRVWINSDVRHLARVQRRYRRFVYEATELIQLIC